MQEISYKTLIVKCVNSACQNNIQLSIGKIPFGFNVSGGWVLECEKCLTKFPYIVKNPDDCSSVKGGAKVIDSWDNDFPDFKNEMLKKHGLEDFPANFPFDNLLLIETGEYEKPKFNHIEKNIFFCPKCNTHLEPIAYSRLEGKLESINQAISSYLNIYLKGRAGNPDCVIVLSDYKCSCGLETKLVLSKNFVEKELPIEKIEELILIDVVGAKLDITIDGIYNRDNCLAVLQKLLIRWQIYYNKIFLAVPFIGFEFKNSEEKRVELWNWILKNTVPKKTTILTRKTTFKSFLDGSKNTGLDIDVLKNYGLLNPTIDGLSEKKSLFKTNFHAKFYAGFDRKSAEVLVGSFNIHEGGYFENIHFKKYDFYDFFERYILNMGIFFDPRVIDESGEILFITENANNSFAASIEKYDTSRREKISDVINNLKKGSTI